MQFTDDIDEEEESRMSCNSDESGIRLCASSTRENLRTDIEVCQLDSVLISETQANEQNKKED